MTLLERRFRRQGQAISHRGGFLPAETGTVTDVTSSDPRSPSFLTHTQDAIITSMAVRSGSFCRGAPRISLQVRSIEELVHSWTPHYLLHHSHLVSSVCLVKFSWFLVFLYTNLLIFKCNHIDIYLFIQKTLLSTSWIPALLELVLRLLP